MYVRVSIQFKFYKRNININYYLLHFNSAVEYKRMEHQKKKKYNATNLTYETNEFNEWKEMNFFDAVKFRSLICIHFYLNIYVAKFYVSAN